MEIPPSPGCREIASASAKWLGTDCKADVNILSPPSPLGGSPAEAVFGVALPWDMAACAKLADGTVGGDDDGVIPQLL
jgi:hypothetical protein